MKSLFRRFPLRRPVWQAERRHFTIRDNALKRNGALKTSYPGLFNPGGFQKDQQAHIDAAFKNQPQLIAEWNKRAQDMEERGIRFFYEIGGEKSCEAIPEFQPPPEEITKPEPLTTEERDWATLEKRFAAGEKLIAKLDWLKDYQEYMYKGDDHELNLKLMEAMDTLEAMQTWTTKLETEADEWKGVAVPASEKDYNWWLYEWKKSCEFVGNMDHGSSKSHLIAWDKLTAEESAALKKHIDQRETKFLEEVVHKNDPSVTKEKWFKYREALKELWAPMDIEHHDWSDYAKNLFRAAFWQSAERVHTVEKEFARMLEIVDTHRESDVDLMRATYEAYPDLKFRPEAAMRIQARDVQVVAKMLLEIRTKVEASTFERSVKDVIKPYMDNLHAGNKKGLEAGMNKYPGGAAAELSALATSVCDEKIVEGRWTEPGVYSKALAQLESEVAEFNAEPLTVEQVAKEVVPRFCWMLPDDPRKAAVDKFTEQVIQHCKKGGNLAALDKAFWALMPNNNGEEFDSRSGVGPSDHAHIHYFCKYHEVREQLPQYWSLSCLLESDHWEFTGKSPFSIEGKMYNTKLAQDILSKHNIDPICLNLIKILIEDEQCGELREIFKHYKACVQKFAGEVHGMITSAEPLEQKEYDQILGELKKANPSKKFFLGQKVDPSLMAGFVVKAGVQTLDFSLLSEIDTFKKESTKSGSH